ncbi:MAG: hypothetical protein JWN14_1835 [Chthonomonadales bacterium]|nr:hypothetical protein [Chthonomonadales bacterium]
MRHYTLLGLVLMLLTISPSLRADPPASAKKEPFLLTLTVFAPMNAKCGWTLPVDGNGTAHLNVATYPKSKISTFHISAKDMMGFRQVLVEQKFETLGTEYGASVPDSSSRTLSVKEGTHNKTITLRYLRSGDPKASEVKRALLVWNTAQSWFHDPNALDLRPYEKGIMAAHP